MNFLFFRSLIYRVFETHPKQLVTLLSYCNGPIRCSLIGFFYAASVLFRRRAISFRLSAGTRHLNELSVSQGLLSLKMKSAARLPNHQARSR